MSRVASAGEFESSLLATECCTARMRSGSFGNTAILSLPTETARPRDEVEGVRSRIRPYLAPRYDLEEVVGRGASSIVFCAHDRDSDCRVAIKLLTPTAWSCFAKERFLREIRTVGSLDHPNILPLLEAGRVEELLYFVMPLIPGNSLRERLDRSGPLDIRRAIETVADIAAALAHTHAHGIIHRDVKPDNVLFSGARAILADFGVARLTRATPGEFLTSAGETIGTPAYMSPEQAGSEEVDGRSDLYSLGCVLYEALTGEPPFTGRTIQSVLARHMCQPPLPVTVIRPAVPSAVAAVLEKSLQKMPADRFQTAEEFAAALQA